MTLLLQLVEIVSLITLINCGILYPRESETRQIKSLDGLWRFTLNKMEDPLRGHREKWYEKGLKNLAADVTIELMAVPASYNDISTNSSVRDHVGLVWYERDFFVPKEWTDERVFIRFSSVCYAAEVWINGKAAVDHTIGHLPFHGEISGSLNYGEENTIVVAVDNTLLEATIPQGALATLPGGRVKQTYTFDFFNYAGIDRPVVLYTTPKTYITDITISTSIEDNNGIISYTVDVSSNENEIIGNVTIFDKAGIAVASSGQLTDSLTIENANKWWPYLMDPNPGYLYSLQITLLDSSGNLVDKYTQRVGIREVTWNSTSLLINNRPIYLRGFGRHEDSDFRGKGLDLSLILRDFNLIKWIGANSFRTSHYPYAEEIMDLADEIGIMIIDECPAVNTEKFSAELLENHKRSLTELYQRDKNRPSVIIWSVANEPRTQYNTSENYYKEVIAHIKSLDDSRPITVVNNQVPDVDHSAQFADICSFNLYAAWYQSDGDLDVIVPTVVTMARQWHELHGKPVLITEYGGDTLEGLHILPAFIWSEDFQVQLLSKHFQAFDRLREEGFFIGEHIWNFADFKTAQTYIRVGGNKKGIFTRNRQPKDSAHLMRKRYWSLAQNLDNAEVPSDLYDYVIAKKEQVKDEL